MVLTIILGTISKNFHGTIIMGLGRYDITVSRLLPNPTVTVCYCDLYIWRCFQIYLSDELKNVIDCTQHADLENVPRDTKFRQHKLLKMSLRSCKVRDERNEKKICKKKTNVR